MFSFLRNAPSQAPSPGLQQALTQQGLPVGLSAGTLRVVATHGSYAGRSVRFFRVFDPHMAAQRGVVVRTFKDLDAHADLVMGSGHFENRGALCLTERVPATTAPTPSRQPADRSAHADDEHLVFWDEEGSRSSALHLSAAAATWRDARSSQAAEAALKVPGLERA
jgi:hypothetical protein